MILLVSVCNIPWWAILLASIIPAVLGWLLSNEFAKSKHLELRAKIKQLQLELKKCYEDKQIVSTKLVTPESKFSDEKVQPSEANPNIPN